MTQEKKLRLENLLTYLRHNKKRLVIDADTHISDLGKLDKKHKNLYNSSHDYYQGKPVNAEQLIAEMDMTDIDMSLCWVNPSVIQYNNSSFENYEFLKSAISYVIETAEKYPMRIIPTGWIDPKSLGMEKSKDLVAELVKDMGLLVIKMNPAQNGYPMDHPDVRTLVKLIVELGAIPAFHYGADTSFTPPESLIAIADFIYPHKLLAVHMGGGGASFHEGETMYRKTRELGLTLDNIYFVESAKRDTHIESDFIAYVAAGEQHYKRLMCGSDAPYGRQSWNFGGYRAMFSTLKNVELHTDIRIRNGQAVFTDEICRRFLGENLADLLIEGYDKLLNINH